MKNIIIYGFKFILVSTALITIILVLNQTVPNYNFTSYPTNDNEDISVISSDMHDTETNIQLDIRSQLVHNDIKYSEFSKSWRNFSDHEKNKLSTLGRILFLGEKAPLPTKDKKYNILVWKYGSKIEDRHLKRYSGKRIDPFEKCSVSNCDITYKDEAIKTADIVIIHLHRTQNVKDLPNVQRNSNQIWAFLTDESPYNTFLNGKTKLHEFNGIFNWSMSFRMDSDIPVPYGRTIRKEKPKYNNPPKRRDVLVAIMGSNCGGRNKRWDYVKELQKYINVDVYGGCGPNKCPGHFKADCEKINDYMFYLAFENSNCDEYITEKLWWNAYSKEAIPIVMGANKYNYTNLLPPLSYLNIDNFAKPSTLAEFIKYLNITNEYVSYYQWRNDYEVLQEHGYFGSESYHYCRICEALNYNDKKPKIYTNLTNFWNIETNCHPPWNIKTNEG